MIVAIAVAGSIAMAARRFDLLTTAGAITATVVGAAVLSAGLSWAVLLLFFFVTSSALSRWRAAEREQLIGALIAKEGPRDAMQVLANGGVLAIAAVASTSGGDIYAWQAVGVGAIATATSDTWSTEVGTVLGGMPRSIFSWRQVAPGTSGGITTQGTLAAFGGAFAVVIVAAGVGWSIPGHAVFAGGVGGSVIDTILGANIQERRWCPDCQKQTERRIHSCGTSTVHRGGIRGCNNDVVNLVSTIAGAVITWTLS